MRLSSFLFSFLLLSIAVCGQETRGLSVPKPPDNTAPGKTYALIIGVSKYKNPAIPQLQYADNDAMALKNYLLKSEVDSNNIILLLNENATFINVMQSLDAICNEKAAKGDVVYFYFSGHGDVESRVITNDGYLLPYDAPKLVYAISAININILQTYISTLSAKGVQAIVITDACHSGNLSGGLDGMKNISNVLKTEWRDEMKILSCQPGELSLEGKQWGNGRGLFSYELINGMAGLADKNKDGFVSLRELNLYMMEKVPEESNPSAQNPMLSGDMNKIICKVNKRQLEEIQSDKHTQMYAAVDMKGNEDGLLKGLPDSIKSYYASFKICMNANNLYQENRKESAYLFLMKTPENKNTSLLVGLMKRNLSAAIIKNSNEIIEAISKNDIETASKLGWNDSYMHEVGLLRALLSDRTLKLLNYEPKILYFEASPILQFHNDTATARDAKHKLDKAIELDNRDAILYSARGWANYFLENYQSAISDLKYSITLSPGLSYPYHMIARIYEKLNSIDSTNKYYNQYLRSDFAPMLSSWLAVEALSRTSLPNDSFQVLADRLENRILKIKNKDVIVNNYNGLGYSFLTRNNYAKALYFYKKAISNRQNSDAYIGIGTCEMELGNVDTGAFYFNKAIEMNPVNLDYTFYNIACAYSKKGNSKNVLTYFDRSLKNGFNDYTHIQEDADLDNIRTTPEFKALMKKYFPNEYKE